MAEKYLMGIDIGTSQSKGVITTFAGEIMAYAAAAHETVSIRPGYFEHDPEYVWFQDFKYLVRELLAKSKIASENIQAVGVSAMGPCTVVADGHGHPLRSGILYGIDTRAGRQIKVLEERYGQEYLVRHCGNVLSSQSVGPKIMWVREHEPEIFSRTEMIMTSTSYIVHRLTGRNVMDYYTACAGYTPLFDYEKMCWDESICREIGCHGKLPQLLWSAELAGRITKKSAEETGLSEGTAVNVGTCDAAAEAVSVGAVKPGKTMLMLGSTAFMIAVLDRPVKDIRMWSAPYLFPGTYSLMGGMSAAGLLTKWYLDEFGVGAPQNAEEKGADVYAELIQSGKAIPAGCDGLIALPYFCGERTPIFDSSAKGVFFGLSLNHTKEHLYRALLESTAYGIRDNFHVFDEYGKLENGILTVGGGCKNPLWLQIISDVTGKKQSISEITLGAAYGDAFLAGVAAGMLQKEAIDRWVRKKYKVCPVKSRKEVYDFNFSIYQELYGNTKQLMDKVNLWQEKNTDGNGSGQMQRTNDA